MVMEAEPPYAPRTMTVAPATRLARPPWWPAGLAYDAARTIEAFSGPAARAGRPDTLSGELLKVVEQTMQPTLASLWLRQAASTAGGGPPTVRPQAVE
jgi:hypothetical protein